jgi:5'(3')-deoxyribonucleotidase
MDGVLANFHEHKDGWKFAGSYDFIRNLAPFIESINLVNEMIKNGYKVYISSLCRNEYAKQAKIDWLKQYIPNLKEENIIILIGNAKKVENMKTRTGVLVDDKEANVKQWRKKGLKAVYVETKGIIEMNKIA